MLAFYDVALSPFCQKVKMALIEKALEFESLPADLGAPSAEFAAASPRLEVPALVDNGTAIFDSSIILEYLEDRWPSPALLPADPAGRARARMIEEVCDSQLEAALWGMTEISLFKRADGDLAQRMLAAAAGDVGTIRGWLDAQLGDGPWFNGETFGFADIAVVPYMNTARAYKCGPAPGSVLADWHARTRERPSVQRCVEDSRAALPGFQSMPELVMSGQRPRQYRDHRLEWMLRAGGAEIVADGLGKGTIRFSSLPG